MSTRSPRSRYEVLTGHGVNLDLAALAHLGVENWPHLPLPSSLRPQLPAELDGILLTAMAFERERASRRLRRVRGVARGA